MTYAPYSLSVEQTNLQQKLCAVSRVYSDIFVCSNRLHNSEEAKVQSDSSPVRGPMHLLVSQQRHRPNPN